MTIVNIAWASIGAILQVIVIGFAYALSMDLSISGNDAGK